MTNRKGNALLVIFFWAVLCLAGLIAGSYAPKVFASSRLASADLLPTGNTAAEIILSADPDEFLPPQQTYEAGLKVIKDRFYGPLPKHPKYSLDMNLTYAAVSGLLGSLGDRYTRFLTPDEYVALMEENSGEFSGIGAHLDTNKNSIVIVDTIENSPARKAGLRPADEIIAVNGKSIVGFKLEAAVKLIRGERGTPVTLSIRRNKVAKPMVFRIIRDTVPYDTVKTEILPGNIGYLSLSHFNDQSEEEVAKGLQTLEKKNIRGLIFDLRWNPGGLLDQAVSITSHFVKPGPVVWIKERGGKTKSMRTDSSVRRICPIPLVVLVNKYSASGSEIVAGAVKDTGSGTLVGMKTWGKGLVQTIAPISADGSAVLITTHRYYTSGMVDINKKGIEPDIESDVTEAGFAKYAKSRKLADDEQVQKALSVIRRQLADRAASRE